MGHSPAAWPGRRSTNISAETDLPLVIVVSDNKRSYSITACGLADYLTTLRVTRGYERFLDWGKIRAPWAMPNQWPPAFTNLDQLTSDLRAWLNSVG